MRVKDENESSLPHRKRHALSKNSRSLCSSYASPQSLVGLNTFNPNLQPPTLQSTHHISQDLFARRQVDRKKRSLACFSPNIDDSPSFETKILLLHFTPYQPHPSHHHHHPFSPVLVTSTVYLTVSNKVSCFNLEDLREEEEKMREMI